MKNLVKILTVLFVFFAIFASCQQPTSETKLQIISQTGTDGLGIVWKGELSSAPSNPQVNWAYYNTIDGNSYIYNGSSWDLLAKSGRNGTSGILLWLGSFTTAPSNPSNGWAYYNITDGVSYIYNNGNWTILSKDGDSIIWKGALNTAPQNPLLNWAYYNINEQTSYIWNGSQWDTLATSVRGDTIVTVGISWLGTFASAPSNPVIGNAYYNSTLGASYIYDGSAWQQISKDGIVSGTSTAGYLITWKGSYSSAPSNPKAGWAYYNTSTRKSYIYDGSSWQIMAQDGANGSGGSQESSIIYLGEASEIIDGVTYVVKSYAEVLGDEPYFYYYYKYYYLNGKLRRFKFFNHGYSTDLDYKYTEFVEHLCGHQSCYFETTYYENGKVQYYCQNGLDYKYKYEYFYDSNGNKELQKYYQNDILYKEEYYYANGQKKLEKSYETGVSPSYMRYKTTYYEDGKKEYEYGYSADGTETDRKYNTYYESGNKKTYVTWRNGVIYGSYEYYDDSSKTVKKYLQYHTSTGFEGNIAYEDYYYSNGKNCLRLNYGTDGTIYNFVYYYASGYMQYYYTNSGYLYTYLDGKTTSTSTSSSDYSSKDTYTSSQAAAKLAELKAGL